MLGELGAYDMDVDVLEILVLLGISSMMLATLLCSNSDIDVEQLEGYGGRFIPMTQWRRRKKSLMLLKIGESDESPDTNCFYILHHTSLLSLIAFGSPVNTLKFSTRQPPTSYQTSHAFY